MIRAFLIACAAAWLAPASASQGAPVIDPQNLIADDIQAEALAAWRKAAAKTPFKGHEIAIVDYRTPSSAPRLFIVDMRTGAVEAHYVAHGRGSDPDHDHNAQRFSDVETSGMSSVGAFRGLERYQSPTHGPALRLAGLDATNAGAYRRLIVFHTAGYFDPSAGKFGRSCGCFVVPKPDMERVYGVIADGGFLYAGPARLHDRSATVARDCNTECGNTCPDPLIASKTPERPVTVAAAAPPKPAPRPAPPPAVADVPLPRLKPSLPADPPPVAVASAETPVPAAKPTALLAAATDAPAAPQPDFAVPDPAPGETPVPAPKPAGLIRVADVRE